MLALLGDIHGDYSVLHDAVTKARANGASALIQLGDFGIYPSYVAMFVHVARQSPIPIYFIDGNHEDYGIIKSWPNEDQYHLVKDKLIYLKRGTVLELDGRRIGCLGGAGSIDKATRIRQKLDWFPEEQINPDDSFALMKLAAQNPVDFFVTHCPPQEIITKHFDRPPVGLIERQRWWGVPPEWFDPSAHVVQNMWSVMGKPRLYCGHMHRAVQDDTVRILDINEVVYV